MVGFFAFCCGEGDEEAKYGAIVNPEMAKELGWTTDDETPYSSETSNMPNFEKQISLLLDNRPDSDVLDKRSSLLVSEEEPDDSLRHTIFGRPHDEPLDDFEPPHFPKEQYQIDFLDAAIRSNVLFADLSNEERMEFINSMYSQALPTGRQLITKGDVGDFFYVLEKGSVKFVDGTKTVGTGQAGNSFGELALLYEVPRAVSCIASSPCVVWKAHRRLFQYVLTHHNMHRHHDLKRLLRKISLFQDLDDRTLDRFVKVFTPLHWKEGTKIIRKGDEGSIFYIIQEGRVKVHDIGLGDSQTEDMILGPGDWFGEQSLLMEKLRESNVTALTDAVTMVMDKKTFETCLGPLQHLLDRSLRQKGLQTMPVFNDITNPEIVQLADLMQEVCYAKGKHLAKAGEPYVMNLYLIRSGRLLVYSEEQDQLYNLEAGDFFGDKSIKGLSDKISKYNVVCEENLTVWVLSRENIESVVGDLERLGKIEAFEKNKMRNPVSLGELKRRRVIGKGAFGKVWAVTHSTDDGETKAYALKTISKSLLIDSKLHKAVLYEKELLTMLRHPFILDLIASYQDETYLYLLMPIVLGGELYEALRKFKTPTRGMANDSAAFYCACIIEALGYMHRRDIAYRDLKLENVLIDEEGYCKIIDLGFAKVVSDKTFTVCGTTEYLAPEILLSKGHDHAVDYWAYGVLMYELVVGRTPFFRPRSSQLDTFKRIIRIEYDFPDYADPGIQDLIGRLLVRPQTARFGNLAKGHIDIKRHDWFRTSGIEFNKLLGKDATPPWRPDVSDPTDPETFEEVKDVNIGNDAGRRLSLSEQELFRGF